MYDEDMDLMHPNRIKMVNIALEVLQFDSKFPLTVIDLGTGTGFFTQRFLEKFPHSSVIAIDGSDKMLNLARTRLKAFAQSIDFRVGDLRKLNDIISNVKRVDVIYSSYALHHLNNHEKLNVIKQSIRHLKPGGWFLNADLVLADNIEIEQRIQQIRVNGILQRAKNSDKRFKDYESVRNFLITLETNENDQPLTLSEDLEIMKDAGLKNVSVFWQEYREVVYGGQK